MTHHPPAMRTCERCEARFSLTGDRVEGTGHRARSRCPRCQDVTPLEAPVDPPATQAPPDDGPPRPTIAARLRALGALAGMFAVGALIGALGVSWLAHRAAPGPPSFPPTPHEAKSVVPAGPKAEDAAMETAQAHKSLARLLRRQGHFKAAQQASRRYRKERLPATR